MNKRVLLTAGLLLLTAVIGISTYFLKGSSNFDVSPPEQSDNATKPVQDVNRKCLGNNEVASYEDYSATNVGTITVSVKNNEDNREISSFDVEDVLVTTYHAIQLADCSVYVSREFNFDFRRFKRLPGFSVELWRYNYDGLGEKLLVFRDESFSENEPSYSYAFSVDPTERFLVLRKAYFGHPDYSLVFKNLNTKEDVFILRSEEIYRNYPKIVGDFGIINWTSDGRYFWADIFEAANVNGYVRVDTQNWTYEILEAPKDVLGGDALNLENGYVTVHPGNVWFGIDVFEEEEKEKRRKEGIGTDLYIENLFTREKHFVVHTDEPLWYFKPKWVSATELQYTIPDGGVKVFSIPKTGL